VTSKFLRRKVPPVSSSESPAKIRVFVAIHPDLATIAELQHFQTILQKSLDSDGIRWARSEQLHLTLQFLGYVERERLPEFEKALAEICSKGAPFQLSAQAVGCFPSERKPRILWAGLAGDLAPLQKMKSALDEKFSALGYVPEKREFHPHLTLARIEHLKLREIEQLGREIVSHQSRRFGVWNVEKVDLMQSVLFPAGAKYSLLKAFSLGGSGGL
jgi:RNA 2',3'-cyclic 3'-phosphodiesterase